MRKRIRSGLPLPTFFQHYPNPYINEQLPKSEKCINEFGVGCPYPPFFNTTPTPTNY